MICLLVIAQKGRTQTGLYASLTENGFTCSSISDNEEVMEQVARQSPELVLVEMGNSLSDSRKWEVIQKIKQEKSLPIIVLVPGETLDGISGQLDVDDFITSPYDAKELALRIRRLLHKAKIIDSGQLIKCDNLMIDLARCEVMVEGKIVELTFREYELLKFLASNKGHVYTREALLDRVWGYDYYGGDRTVDVHVRRLRSKIEDSTHTFIETVRNIGYRFRMETQ